MNTREKYKKYIIGNYGEPSLVLKSAKASYVYDESDKKYLDFGAGIAVLSLGHSNAFWIKAITEQAQKMVHCSNLYANEPQANLAEKLVTKAKFGKVFFCNSGAEANEALIKSARLYGEKFEEPRHKIIVAKNSFHGRTMATLSATMQEKVQKHFAPYVPTFLEAEFNNIESFAQYLEQGDVAAVLIEPIQGESGVLPADKAFLKELRALCNKHSSLLFFDEVQCGIARTSKFYAFEKFGVVPDGISMAKGLGSGFPIGAVLIKEKIADLFLAGTHGTTYGGNPLACSAALAVVEYIDKKNICDNVKAMSKILKAGLNKLAKKYSNIIKLARGEGLMLAILLQDEYLNSSVVAKLIQNGLITIPAGANAIRFLPPLTVKENEIKKALDILEKTLKSL